MSHLPARPLRLKKGYALKLLATAGPVFALAVALGVGMVVYGAMQAQDLLGERALWKNGALSTSASVEGEVKTKNILLFLPISHEYKLNVTFRDQGGVVHVVKYEADSLVEKADTSRDPEVRYDPANPERIAVSWIADLVYGRWLFSLLLLAMGVVVPAGGYQFLRAALRAVRSARACSERSDEISVKVLSLEKLKTQYGTELKKWRLTFELPPSPIRRGGKREVVLDGEPITVRVGEETRAIGLLSNRVPEHPTFPLRDLHPFEASPEQLKALEAALPRT
jgi:hypothetical protein